MKNKFLNRLIAVLTISLALFLQSCQKEISGSGGSNFNEVPAAKTITATVEGQVYDENGAIMANAAVEVNGSTTTTNKYGVFRFENVSLNQNGGVVKVTKAGYFNGYRSMFYSATETNFMRIQLMPKQLIGTIDAATGGTVTLGTASVSLPANGVVKAATSTAFTGNVQVYAAYMDPSKSSTLLQMPGNLFGTQTNNTLAGLESYGMLAVELESAAGEKLQVATGSEATLNFPATAAAPATIALWYFDETTGFWKEEGTATKSGASYVAKVKHFSYWNCDAPFPIIEFKAKFIDQNGNPLVHKQVVITRTTGNFTSGSGYTDSLGKTSGKIPKNESLVLTLKGECGQIIYTQNIGPYSANVDLGTITVTTATASMVEVKGKLVDCSNVAVTNGYVSLLINNFYYRANVDASGNFVIHLLNCSGATTAAITGYDIPHLQEGTPASVAITSGTVNVGNVVACGTVIQTSFFNYTFGGSTYSITAPPDSLTARFSTQGTTISGMQLQGAGRVYLGFSGGETVGTHPFTYFSSNILNASVPTGTTLNITAFGSVGQFIEGNFTGNVKDSTTNVMVPLNLSFKVRRN